MDFFSSKKIRLKKKSLLVLLAGSSDWASQEGERETAAGVHAGPGKTMLIKSLKYTLYTYSQKCLLTTTPLFLWATEPRTVPLTECHPVLQQH